MQEFQFISNTHISELLTGRFVSQVEMYTKNFMKGEMLVKDEW